MAREAGVKRLLLGHFSSRYDGSQLLEQQAQEVFPNAIAVKEGMTFDLNKL